MSASPLRETRPTARRPFSFGRLAPWLLAALAAPLYVAFVWQPSIATMADDSLSYVILARWFEGSAGATLSPWLPWHTHFPPAFPMVLAATGSAQDLLRAHWVVAAFAVVSLVLMARYAALRLASDWGGFWLAAAFLALPTAWLGAKGILSEPMYMAVTIGALLAHERWIAPGPARWPAHLAFAVLVALACSTRVAGVTLLAALVVHEVIGALRARRFRAPSLLAFLVPVAAMLAWSAMRPGGHAYSETARQVLAVWLDKPGAALDWTLNTFPSGWVSTFMAEGEVAFAMRMCAYLIGAVALAGSVRAALANRLDGWYVLATLALTFAWLFGVENMRRLLYPVVPLLLLHAAEIVLLLVRRTRIRHAYLAVAAICAIPLAACAPATLLIASKARDRGPFVPGSRFTAAEITDYYRVMNLPLARELAAKHAATLGGLERLASETPAGSRIMWMRPEYVAILGERPCVPYRYAWDARTFATHVRDDAADYIVVAGMAKNDLSMSNGDPAVALAYAAPYTQPVFRIGNPFTAQEEFILLRVDRAALDRHLAGG